MRIMQFWTHIDQAANSGRIFARIPYFGISDQLRAEKSALENLLLVVVLVLLKI